FLAAQAPILVPDLLAWPDQARWNLLTFLAEFRACSRLTLGEDPTEHDDLFEVVLTLLCGPDDIDRCRRARRLALEAAALVHPDGLEPACTRILELLRRRGVKGLRIGDLLQEAKRLAGRGGGACCCPRRAAEAYLEYLGVVAGLAAGAVPHPEPDGNGVAAEDLPSPPALHYHQDQYYRWHDGRWVLQADGEVKTQLT